MELNDKELLRLLKHGRAEELAELAEEMKPTYADSFPAFMDQMLKEHHLKRSTVARRSGLSQDYLYKLLRGDKRTTERDYIIAICMAAGLNIAQTQHLQPGFSMEFAQENGFADTWHVAALAEDFPYSGNTVTSNTVESLTLQLVTSRSVFQAFLNRQADLGRSGAYYWQVQYIHPESISALTSGLEEWSLNNSYGLPQGVISANYNSLAMGGLQRFGMLLQILCTGFVLLLCLVCMANIHNSLSTGMELRAREYGILRSVGITPVDFRKMIWLESLFYGIKALCWSLPFGMGVLALEYYAIRRAFQLPFCLPVGSIVLAVVLVMGVCWISGLLTRRSLEEQTITEAIQKRLF